MSVRVLLSMGIPFILGIDTLRAFGLNIHFGDHFYTFSSDPTRYYRFLSESEMAALIFGNTSSVMTSPKSGVEELNSVSSEGIGKPVSDSSELQSLTDDQGLKLRELIEREIPSGPAKAGVTNLISHHIYVGDGPAIKQRYYPVSQVVEAALFAEVDNMLAKGMIEPSNSDW